MTILTMTRVGRPFGDREHLRFAEKAKGYVVKNEKSLDKRGVV